MNELAFLDETFDRQAHDAYLQLQTARTKEARTKAILNLVLIAAGIAFVVANIAVTVTVFVR